MGNSVCPGSWTGQGRLGSSSQETGELEGQPQRPVSVRSGCTTKHHRLSPGSTNRKVFAPVSRLEVRDQGVARFSFYGGFSPWIFSVCAHPWSPSLCALSSSCKNSSQISLAPTITASFQLNQPFKGPISEDSHTLRSWRG